MPKSYFGFFFLNIPVISPLKRKCLTLPQKPSIFWALDSGIGQEGLKSFFDPTPKSLKVLYTVSFHWVITFEWSLQVVDIAASGWFYCKWYSCLLNLPLAAKPPAALAASCLNFGGRTNSLAASWFFASAHTPFWLPVITNVCEKWENYHFCSSIKFVWWIIKVASLKIPKSRQRRS